MLKEKLKALMVKQEKKDSKKKIENLVVFILILIVTIIAINTIWKGNKKKNSKEDTLLNNGKQLATTQTTTSSNTGNDGTNTTDMETKLETILSNMNGVGKVKVLITYLESSEVVAMYNENSKNSKVEEKDSGGGTRTTTQQDIQKDIIYQEESGEKIPITQKVVSPKIEGAIITAQGANSATVKNDIVQAVEAVTGLASHKIQVFEMRKD